MSSSSEVTCSSSEASSSHKHCKVSKLPPLFSVSSTVAAPRSCRRQMQCAALLLCCLLLCCLLLCCLLFAVCCLLFAASAAAGEAKPIRYNFCINPPPNCDRNNCLPPHINHELSVVSSFPPHRRPFSHALPAIWIFWHFQQVQNCPCQYLEFSSHTMQRRGLDHPRLLP